MITLTSGPAQVLTSGMATCFMGHGLTLAVHEPVPFQVTFAFESDTEKPDVHVEVLTEGDDLVLMCTNFDDDRGRGSAVPVLLGEIEELLVFLHFRVFRHGRTDDRTVHYTLFAVEKDAVDWQPASA